VFVDYNSTFLLHMNSADFCVLNWPVEQRGQFYHSVSHKLRLAGPGWLTQRVAQRAAANLLVTQDNAASMAARYTKLFGARANV